MWYLGPSGQGLYVGLASRCVTCFTSLLFSGVPYFALVMESSSKSTLRKALVSVGFLAEQPRRDVVLDFLLKQEIYSFDDFEGLRHFELMAGSEVLSREEVDFLEALAKSMCRSLKRRAHGQAAPVLAVPAEPPQGLQAEELLSLPASSNLAIAECVAIAECGPRAAGKLLASVLRSGVTCITSLLFSGVAYFV